MQAPAHRCCSVSYAQPEVYERTFAALTLVAVIAAIVLVAYGNRNGFDYWTLLRWSRFDMGRRHLYFRRWPSDVKLEIFLLVAAPGFTRISRLTLLLLLLLVRFSTLSGPTGPYER